MLAKQTGLTQNQVNSYVTCILVWTRCSCFIQVRISELVKSPNQTKPIRIPDELSKFAADDACVVAVGVLGGSGGMDGLWANVLTARRQDGADPGAGARGADGA